MSKEKLSIASTEPVSLEETDTKTIAKSDVSESYEDPKSTDKDASVATKDNVEAESQPDTKNTEEEGTKKTTELKEVKVSDTTTKAAGTNEDEDAPPPPPRPLSPAGQIKKDLKDAFPQIEDKYIEAVLIASDGRADSAFNALLFLLDPSFKPEPVAAVNPPKPKRSTLTDDEILARQLQKEFEREDRRRRSRSHNRQHKDLPPAPEDDSPDEFDQIKETFTQGFEEAKTTLNSWVSGISKKFSQDDNQSQQPQRPGRNQSPKLFGALGGSSFNNNTKKGKNFDEDPEILALDFRKNIDLDDDKPPQLPKREEAKKTESKWQPLNSDVPVTSDAFLVTDLEDEDKK